MQQQNQNLHHDVKYQIPVTNVNSHRYSLIFYFFFTFLFIIT